MSFSHFLSSLFFIQSSRLDQIPRGAYWFDVKASGSTSDVDRFPLSSDVYPSRCSFSFLFVSNPPSPYLVATRMSRQFLGLIIAQFFLLSSNLVCGFTPSSLTSGSVLARSEPSRARTLLPAKKKAGASSAPAKGKVQVKLLKHVAGTGQAGEVVMVTPAFFNNKLRPTQSAKIVSDEEVAQEKAESVEQQREAKEKATELQEKISGLQVIMKRKSGPDGQLFGGINAKAIMTEVHSAVGDDFLNQKGVKISEITDENGKKMRGDIKHTGQYGSRISLLSGISAKFDIEVLGES